MMVGRSWPLGELMPHRHPSLLLHDLKAWDDLGVHAIVRIEPGIPFLRAPGVPAHVGLEYMAQACAAWAGCQARRDNAPVLVGYLLGTRDFTANVPYFPMGSSLDVIAKLEFRDGAMGVFQCSIHMGLDECARARVNVYQPTESQGGGSLDNVQNDTRDRR